MKRRAIKTIVPALLALLGQPIPVVSLASDHVDGPVTRREGGADITDLYAFPAPDSGWLVLIMNLYPLLPANGHFQEAVSYEFLLRPAAVAGTGLKTAFSPGDEIRIACRFSARGEDEPDTVHCSGGGIEVSGPLGETAGDRARDGALLFAGRRADPFFFNAEWATKASEEGVLLEPEDDNIMEDANVLSIVIEIEASRLGLGTADLLAVAAQTMTRDAEDAPWRRLDRIGRPEITNVSMVAHGDDEELRDAYNQLAPFSADVKDLAPYRARLRRNIGFFDAIDQVEDWPSQWVEVLADLLVQDYLLVDLSKPCGGSSYFAIESSLLRTQRHTRCGGRLPQDDVMDRVFTLLINAGQGRPLRDGVDAPTPALPVDFPYLAEPSSGPAAWLKAFFGQKKVRPSAH